MQSGENRRTTDQEIWEMITDKRVVTFSGSKRYIDSRKQR